MSSVTGNKTSKRPVLLVRPGVSDYETIHDIQKQLVQSRYKDLLDHDVLFVLEHKSVFTLGKRGGEENLLVSRDSLSTKGIPLVQTGRGGDITWHGPGQIVLYPVTDLRSGNLGVEEFVSMLEDVVIRAMKGFGINAGRDPRNRGVWVGNAKIASVGIALFHRISYHGLALNVNCSMEQFQWINPCGLMDIGVTSMEREMGESVSCDDAAEVLISCFSEIFGCTFKEVDISDIKSLFNPERTRSK